MNEPNDNDYAMEAANSALVDLEAAKDEENPFRVQAKAAIERGDQVCHDVARNQGQIYDNVKHMSWFVDAVAEELEMPTPVDVAAEITKAFAYASGAGIEDSAPKADDGDDDADEGYRTCEGCGGEFASEDCRAISRDTEGKNYVCPGCYDKLGLVEETSDVDPALPAMNEVTTAALDARPMTVTLETQATDVIDASDDAVRHIGEQARTIADQKHHIASLSRLLNQANKALEYKTQESDRRLQARNDLNVRLDETLAEARKQAKRIKGLETIILTTETFITKNRPRQPTARARNFDALAESLRLLVSRGKGKALKAKAPAKKPVAKKAPAKKRR